VVSLPSGYEVGGQMDCPNCHKELKRADIVCGVCGRPVISVETPRIVQFRSTGKNRTAIFIVCLYSVVFFIVSIYLLAGPITVDFYGKKAIATWESVTRIPGRRNDIYTGNVAFVDSHGNSRTGTTESNLYEFEHQYHEDPLGISNGDPIEIRYFDFYQTVGRGHYRNSSKAFYLSLYFILIVFAGPIFYLYVLRVKKNLLVFGTLRSAEVLEVIRGRKKFVKIELNRGMETRLLKVSYIESEAVEPGTELRILDGGAKYGAAVFGDDYPWECVRVTDGINS
jgi:hypothetical protein